MIAQKDKKVLLSNFLSLASLQGVNYILPLLTFPYLVRVLGVENFGLLAFATAVISYFNILTDYGFNLTATKEVSIHREDKDKIIEIFSAVMTIKFILMLVSFILLCIIVFTFDKLHEHWSIYLLTFGTVIGNMLFPIWFFQGIEKMKYITYLNILSKSIFTIAIFVFVHNQEDVYLVPLFTSSGFILSGLLALVIIKKDFDVDFKFQTIETIKFYIIDGWHIFVSRIYVSLYTTTNTIFLGLLTNNTIVGYYSIAEKIVSAFGGLFIPVNQAIYPYMAKLLQANKNQFYSFVKKISILYISASVVLFSILYTLNHVIIEFVSGNYSVDVDSIYTILLFTIFTIPFGAFLTQILIINKLNKEFSLILRNTFILNAILAPLGIFFFKAVGLAIVVVLSQAFVITLCYLKIINYKRNMHARFS